MGNNLEYYSSSWVTPTVINQKVIPQFRHKLPKSISRTHHAAQSGHQGHHRELADADAVDKFVKVNPEYS